MRTAERGWLIPQLGETFARMTRADILAKCERANVPFAPVGRPDELQDDPQLAVGGLLDTVLSSFGEAGKSIGLPALPLEFGAARERLGLRSQPPRIGQHGADVLREAGYSAAEIEALANRGVVPAAA